jgi:hypothetical protein
MSGIKHKHAPEMGLVQPTSPRTQCRQAIETLAVPTLTKPTDPPTEATRSQIRIWEKRIDEFVKKETHLEENRKSCTLLSLGNVPEP